ncbi:MAG: sulfatase-like hydrolase/transferase [Caldilineaceae bacterium SB0675_bin_29]|uniref:Sulfatase-like hydrolase/transferase n=1 Tax=Caldilineaceae bacterium SB0675_bin_29 TaxID=2605266 RepID=A0A6B1G1G0_9CHLR|nr:sulfatase-like hydrolase/transferase [Caldilineaceae bacterium SB0675_bin_29]
MAVNLRPNVLLIMADDHAPAAFSTYGNKLNQTPNLDRIAGEGLRLDRCFCTNAICTPARASVHTGKYSHTTGIKTLNDVIDQTQETTLGMLLHGAGYQTAFVGKWHLGHGGNSDPAGYDYWSVLPVQGRYYDPEMSEMGEPVVERGYVTDVLTDKALSWLEKRETDRPFFLVCAHKAPHDPFQPNRKHMGLFAEEPIPEPATFHDDYRNRAGAIDRSTTPEWELFDLEEDPKEMRNIYHEPANAGLVSELKVELEQLQRELGDRPFDRGP